MITKNEIAKFIFENMNFEYQNFPEELCTIQNKNEPEVLDSDSWFYCVIENDRFDDEIFIKKMKPYTYRDDEHGILYGFIDESDVLVSCAINPVNPLDSEKVIAWVKA